jgi:hypothetical protein
MQPSLKRVLERAAADEERSTTSLIEKVLKDYLRGKRLWPPTEQHSQNQRFGDLTSSSDASA